MRGDEGMLVDGADACVILQQRPYSRIAFINVFEPELTFQPALVLLTSPSSSMGCRCRGCNMPSETRWGASKYVSIMAGNILRVLILLGDHVISDKGDDESSVGAKLVKPRRWDNWRSAATDAAFEGM